MKGEWIQAASGTWHLIWDKGTTDSDKVWTSWCARTFAYDDPTKSGAQLSYDDVLHDECLRKSEEL